VPRRAKRNPFAGSHSYPRRPTWRRALRQRGLSTSETSRTKSTRPKSTKPSLHSVCSQCANKGLGSYFRRGHHRSRFAATSDSKPYPASKSFVLLVVHLPGPLLTFTENKHRGFAFVTYASTSDAQDAIDNMDQNELAGQVIKVNLAKPMKGLLSAPIQNRASTFILVTLPKSPVLMTRSSVWESEEWLKEHVKPLQGKGRRDSIPYRLC